MSPPSKKLSENLTSMQRGVLELGADRWKSDEERGAGKKQKKFMQGQMTKKNVRIE